MSDSPHPGAKVALVTGASRGIGAAIAARLARDGMAIAVNYTANATAAQAVVERIVAQGGAAAAFRADVSDVAQTRTLVADVLRHFGRLDILINNAAISEAAVLDEVEEAAFDRHFATNVKAPLFLVKAAADALAEARGAVVNLSSIATRSGSARFHIYAATKAALDMLTQTLARDLGPRGVRVNAVAPGMIETEMLMKAVPAPFRQFAVERTALGRLGQPNDIAEVVAFLASDAAYWVTGETLHASGGQRL